MAGEAASPDETFAVYNGRYHGGWKNLNPSSNASIVITSTRVWVQIATVDKGPSPDARGALGARWQGVKSLTVKRQTVGSEQLGHSHYTRLTLSDSDSETIVVDVPNVEPLEIWRALDRVETFRYRIPDTIAAQIKAAPTPLTAAASPPPQRPSSSSAPSSAPPRKAHRKRLSIALALVVVVIAIAVYVVHGIATVNSGVTFDAYLQSHQSETKPATGWPTGGSVQIVNPADLRVYVEVKNVGTASGDPTCSLQASDPSAGYSGSDAVSKTNPLPAGGVWDFYDDLTITSQGAQYVTQITVSCSP